MGNRFFFILNAENKPQCLICNTIISSIKSFNISRHYSTNHKKDYGHYNGDSRVQILKSLKIQQQTPEKNNPFSDKTLQQQCLAASYAVSLEIARAKKCFSDGELIKKCAIEMARAFDNTHAI